MDFELETSIWKVNSRVFLLIIPIRVLSSVRIRWLEVWIKAINFKSNFVFIFGYFDSYDLIVRIRSDFYGFMGNARMQKFTECVF